MALVVGVSVAFIFLIPMLLQPVIKESLGVADGPAEETIYEIEDYRTYERTKCRGVLTSKCEDFEYIEVFFVDKDGKDSKFNVRRDNVKIDLDSRIEEISSDNHSWKSLFLSKEDYLNMWEEE